MITEQPFLPLFFNAEDEDLWLKLQKLPIEKRSELTKQALREFFQAHPVLMQIPSHDVQDDIKESAEFSTMGKVDEENSICEIGELGDPLPDSAEQVEFSLESLFEMSPAEAKSNPVYNLLAIIGVEEDEEVLRLFRRTEEHKEE